jgi:hypothetical protein
MQRPTNVLAYDVEVALFALRAVQGLFFQGEKTAKVKSKLVGLFRSGLHYVRFQN